MPLGLTPAWRRFFRDNAHLGISALLSQGSTLLFSALLARRSSEDFGYFQYFLSIVGILAVFSLPGLEQAFKIEVAQGGYPLGQFLKAKLRYGWLAAGMALIVAGILYAVGHRAVALTSLLAAPLLPLYYSMPLYNAALEGKLQFDLLARLRVTKTVTVHLVLILPITGGGSVRLISLGYLLLNIVLDGVVFLYLHRRHPNQPLPLEQFTNALSYSRKLTFINGLGLVRQHADRFIVGSCLPASALAIYAIARGFSQRLRFLSTTISRTLFPRLAAVPSARARDVIRHHFPRWLGFTVCASLAAMLLARPYVLLIFGSGYTDSIFLSYILILIMGLGMLAMPLGTLFESQRRTDVLYRSNVVASILEIGLLVLLIPVLQLSGVLWGKAVARVYLCTMLLHAFARAKEPSTP